MKFGMMNELTNVNRFVLHSSHRNIVHLAVITRKTNMKIDILKVGGGGVEWKKPIQVKKHCLNAHLTLIIVFTLESLPA